jgi:hypothetical protein
LNKGLFPVTGMDNLFGSQANITGGKYPPAGVITGLATLLINNKGIFRTSAEGDIY